MKALSAIFCLLVFVVACGFALMNPADVTVHYYVGQVTWPLAVVVILAFVLGGVLGMLIGWGKGRRSGKLKMKLKLEKQHAKQAAKSDD